MISIIARRLSRCALLACGCTIPTLPIPAYAADVQAPTQEELITVNAARHRINSADTTDLLRNDLGFSAYSAGGISALPVLNGMADDRIATFIDGMRLSAGCPNHMNPAMSYIDPDAVSSASAIAGITSVKDGGDSTGGTISITRKAPVFSKSSKLLITGEARGTYRSNGGGSGASGSITVANDWISLRYTGSYAHASNYHTGGTERQVLSTSYLTFNHAVILGIKHETQTFTLTAGQQDTPYEGFPNQYMDLTNNRSTFVNGKYTNTFHWGTVEANAFWQRVSHAMNMLSDKGGHSETEGMPMNTDQRTAGYSLKSTIQLSASHTIGIGSAFEHNGLNDWWPPLLASMMMGPNTFHNINHGHRNHLGHYAEWNAHWTSRLSTELGLRSDIIMMNTGPVSPYSWVGMMNMADAMAAKRFNTLDRRRTDYNFDITALAHWNASDMFSIEGGYARKTRSPNLYERYAWGRGAMTMQMIGWFGDGNGYVGNPNLTPEIANTISTTLHWHDKSGQLWELQFQPYFTYTHHYINVTPLTTLSNGRRTLIFANHDAQSYGINNNAFIQLWNTDHYGKAVFHAHLNWVRGQDLVTHAGLYQQMPANGSLRFQEAYGAWSAYTELTLVKKKSTVDLLRGEPHTPGYALLDFGGTYHWRAFTLEGSIENLMNQHYFLPLGGLSFGDYDHTGFLSPLPGLGRSFNLSLSAKF
ncbi:TonB-dependent IMP dehydrogenase [Neokomagataea thailandica NBRC 106555]|uniref:TonB-dependent receptor n=2 Tax=Neokomagataea TaxID=1223423 RepID=A0A4Y6V5H3_9PROT|nr:MULTISPECIES: TonB-dependent receptor [Neokomagataea]QDH25362.1 TonB-dependent receptor [Neokomagataea tanensis]GBR53607.1 TonB-dependent IMP dehydrogenase [Neokomagataea thailandica NBRC 106555]